MPATSHPVKGHPWVAALYDTATQEGERRFLGPLRSAVVSPAVGRVLEIGAGTGANFSYYTAAGHVVATEPDPFMLRRAQKRRRAAAGAITLLRCPAEALPFDDGSFDTVVASLVLCSVLDPRQALSEVRRVLRPGGTFRFIEHVRADSWVGTLQDILTPLQRRLVAGCHLNRKTVEHIRAVGFTVVDVREQRLPLMPLMFGVAKRT